MKNSASRLQQHTGLTLEHRRNTVLPFASRELHEHAIHSIMSAPVEPQPLLALQRLAFQDTSAICVCDGFRSAQRYFYENARDQGAVGMQPYLVHEMMPSHQQDYIIDCLNAMRDTILPCTITLFTTHQFYHQLSVRLPWLMKSSETIKTAAAAPALPIMAPMATSAVTVSCICLRTGSGGRWLLMDHDEAATVQPDATPATALVPRLLRHTVNISGNHLAPYLAMMFDVPHVWKVHPELATRSLLIFDKYTCALGCRHSGIPSHITWSDILGIIY